MNILELRNRFRDKILQVARECHISSVKIFGSTIHGDATEKSDVDFLISLKKEASLLDIGRFKWKVEEILQKKIDVAFENKLHHSITPQILKEAQVL